MKTNPLFKKEILFLPIFFGFGEDVGARWYYMFLCDPDRREDGSLELLQRPSHNAGTEQRPQSGLSVISFSGLIFSITGLPVVAAASPIHKLLYIPLRKQNSIKGKLFVLFELLLSFSFLFFKQGKITAIFA